MIVDKLQLFNQIGTKIVITNSSPPIFRETEYYRCNLVYLQDKRIQKQLYKFTGLCNPYISLLDAYITLALPTTNIVNRQFVHFIIKCIKIYRKQDCLNIFIQQFLNENKQYSNPQIKKMLTEYIRLSYDQLENFDYEKFPILSYNSLSKQLKKSFDQKYFTILVNRMKTNLEKLEIMPKYLKLRRIKNLAQSLQNYLESQIYWNKNKTQIYLLTKSADLKVQKNNSLLLTTLQQLVFSQQNLKIQLEGINAIGTHLLKQMQEFQNCSSYYYKKSIYKSYYDISFKNIIINLVENSQNLIRVHQVYPCHLDYMIPFMCEIGLQQQPSSPENTLVFHSTPYPCLLEKNFESILQTQIQKQRSNSKTHIKQVEAILKWFLILEYCNVKLLHLPRLAIIEAITDKKQIIKVIQDMNPSLICETMNSILFLYSIDSQTNSSSQSNNLKISSLNFEQIKKIIADPDIQDNKRNEQKKYYLFKILLNVYIKLFFNPGNIRQFIQKNKFASQIINAVKYIHNFLFAKYIQLSIEKLILEVYQDLTEDIKHQPRYQMIESIEKLQSVFRIVKKKFDQYKLRNQSDSCRRYLIQSQNQEQRRLFQELKDKSFGQYYFNFVQYDSKSIKRSEAVKDKTKKINQLLERIHRQCNTFFQTMKKQKQNMKNQQKFKIQQSYSNYAKAQKCELLISAFFKLNRANCASIECFEKSLCELSGSIHYSSKDQIQQIFKRKNKQLEDIFQSKERYHSLSDVLTQ